MIPRLLLRVLCRKAEILMSLIYQISVLWHSSPLRHNLLFFPMMIMNGDIFVIDFLFDAKTINLDLFSTSNSSSIIFFPFLRWCTLDFGFETKRWLHGAMYNSSPSLSALTTECQHGRYLHSEYLRQKVSEIPEEFLDERKLRIRAGSPMKQPFEIQLLDWHISHRLL